MDEIKLAITNQNNVDYKQILLRKFFYMIFIDANGKKLYAYIATVFGGLTEDISELDDACKSIKHVPDNPCKLHFEISSNNIVEKARIINISDSFFKQTKYIDKVWGECTTLNSQEKAGAALKELYPELYSSEKKFNLPFSTNTQVIQIKDKKNTSQTHNCIVTIGDYLSSNTTSDTYSYDLSCPISTAKIYFDGLEAMNWIKVELDLKRNILEESLLFSIELEKGAIYTPDFTWYFAPPFGTVVNADSYVKIGGNRVNNVIQSVSDETTVYFDEWVDPPETISERKKSRVLFKHKDEIGKCISDYDHNKLSEYGTLSVSLQLDNPQEPSNRQFIAGLVIAFLLSFCTDKTRINDYFGCLKIGCTCENTICWCQTLCNTITIAAPILLCMCFFSIILRPKKALPPTVNTKGQITVLFMKVLRGLGLISTLSMVLYVYFLWGIFPVFMRLHISCQLNMKLLIIGAIISVVSNLTYILYCTLRLKRKLFNYV